MSFDIFMFQGLCELKHCSGRRCIHSRMFVSQFSFRAWGGGRRGGGQAMVDMQAAKRAKVAANPEVGVREYLGVWRSWRVTCRGQTVEEALGPKLASDRATTKQMLMICVFWGHNKLRNKVGSATSASAAAAGAAKQAEGGLSLSGHSPGHPARDTGCLRAGGQAPGIAPRRRCEQRGDPPVEDAHRCLPGHGRRAGCGIQDRSASFGKQNRQNRHRSPGQSCRQPQQAEKQQQTCRAGRASA